MGSPPSSTDGDASNLLDRIKRQLAAYRDLADTGEDVAARIAALEEQLRSAEYHASVTGSAGAQVIAGNNNIQVYINEHVSAAQREVVRRWFNEYMLGVWSEHSSLALVGSRAGVDQDRIPLGAVYTALDVAAEHVVYWGNDGLETDPPDDEDDAVPSTPELLQHWRGTHWFGKVNEGDGSYHSCSSALTGTDSDYGNALRQELVHEFDEMHQERANRPSSEVGPDRRRWSRRATALEAAAATARRVIVGAPGSGKSTFGRYMALCMAGEHLCRAEADLATLNTPRATTTGRHDAPTTWQPWPHGVVLPVFVELRHFAADAAAFPSTVRQASAASLLRHVESRDEPKIAPDFQPHFRGYLQDGRALLILDGLDEVAEAGARRAVIKRVIADFAERYPQCRIIVTSRPYAYEPGSTWRLDDLAFLPESLADFDADQIDVFVQAWHDSIAARGRLSVDRADRCRASLAARLRTDAKLRPLAGRPLLLTMIADLNATVGSLPSSRAALYEESVKLLLDKWNEAHDKIEDRPMSDESGMPPLRVRAAIEALAYDVHRATGGSSPEAADISRLAVLGALAKARGRAPEAWTADDQRILEYIGRRSGILVSEDEDTYRFPHRSFQEFMAACHLNKLDFPKTIAAESRSAPELWREVVQFVFGRQERTSDVLSLLRKLLPHPPTAASSANDPQCAVALLAALGYADSCLADALSHGETLDEDDAATVERLRLWLKHIVVAGALAPRDRAEAGRVLASLGDDRPGVGLRADGVPDIAWITLPGGTFTMGSGDDDELAWADERPQQSVVVATYRIARYPITVAQFRPFVLGDGYRESTYWTSEGWQWRQRADREQPHYWDDDAYGDYNQPVIGVSWYEAVAYCAWLSRQRSETVCLPTEAAWEYAARGRDGRRYPWGESFGAERCNSGDSGIGRLSAVGVCPLPDGYWTTRPEPGVPDEVRADPLDMSGNVWEWTSTKWRDRPDKSMDDDLKGTASRVVRGGSWTGDHRSVRCACRDPNDPIITWDNLGFRVTAPRS